MHRGTIQSYLRCWKVGYCKKHAVVHLCKNMEYWKYYLSIPHPRFLITLTASTWAAFQLMKAFLNIFGCICLAVPEAILSYMKKRRHVTWNCFDKYLSTAEPKGIKVSQCNTWSNNKKVRERGSKHRYEPTVVNMFTSLWRHLVSHLKRSMI